MAYRANCVNARFMGSLNTHRFNSAPDPERTLMRYVTKPG